MSRGEPIMNTATIEPFLAALADMVAERVLAKLSMTTSATYTTNKRGPNIPGKSRMWALRNVKTMPGARKVGVDWMIAAADFDAWATAQDATSTARRRGAPKAPVDLEEFADACLDAAGYRPTRKAP